MIDISSTMLELSNDRATQEEAQERHPVWMK